MRWAFWRRRQEPDQPHSPAVTPDAARDAWAAERRGDDEQDDRRGAPAFSGASPSPGQPPRAADVVAAPGDDGAPLQDVDLASIRADLVALVSAILVGDRSEVDRLRQRVHGYDDDTGGMAFIGALAVLGERFQAAAGFAPAQAEPGSPEALAAVAEGDRTAVRAEPLLRELAPGAAPELLAFLVRFSLGMPDLAAEPEGAGDDVQSQVVLAVLLAQTCLDGHGSAEDVGARLAELLPG